MHTNRNIPYYLTAAGLFILLKYGYTFADNHDLAFLLGPVDKFVGLLAGSRSVLLEDGGYYHDGLNILIDKSCSGFNFLALSFLVFSYPAIKHPVKPLHKSLAIPVALLCAYLLTIFANASRIFVSVAVQAQTKVLFAGQQHLIHEAVGVVTYLSSLILAYLLIEKLLTHRKHHEKLT